MSTVSIRCSDELKSNIRLLAEKHNRKPHWLMVEFIKRGVQEELERLRFIEEGEREYQKMLADPDYGLTMDQAIEHLELNK